MIYRNADDSYALSSPDGEFSRVVTAAEGQEIIRQYPMPSEDMRRQCLEAEGGRWIIS